MLGHSLPGRRDGASSDESGDGMVVGDGQPQAAAASDDEVHDRPGQIQAARLAREAAHHLRAPLDLAQRSFEQARSPGPPIANGSA